MDQRGYNTFNQNNVKEEKKIIRVITDKNNKRKFDEDYFPKDEQKINKLIVELGDTNIFEPETIIFDASRTLEIEMKNHKVQIIGIIVRSAMSIPAKAPIYGTLVGILNLKLPTFGSEIVDRIHKELNNTLINKEFTKFKLLVRFLCELVHSGVLEISSLIELFDNLLYKSMEDTSPQSRSDYFISVVLNALPWCGKVLLNQRKQDLMRILGICTKYFENRNQLVYFGMRAFEGETIPKDYLSIAYNRITVSFSESWRINSILCPYKQHQKRLDEGTKHKLAPLYIPDYSPEQSFPIFKNILTLFMEEDFDNISFIDRYIVGDYISDIFSLFSDSVQDCAKQIMLIPLKAKLHYIFVEGFFSELLKLPVRETNTIMFFVSLMIVLLEKYGDDLSVPLGKAIDYMFINLGSMDVESFFVLSDYVAFHLSNFDIHWPWDYWEPYTEQTDTISFQQLFLKSLFQKICRVSYRNNLLNRLPNYYHWMAPEEETVSHPYPLAILPQHLIPPPTLMPEFFNESSNQLDGNLSTSDGMNLSMSENLRIDGNNVSDSDMNVSSGNISLANLANEIYNKTLSEPRVTDNINSDIHLNETKTNIINTTNTNNINNVINTSNTNSDINNNNNTNSVNNNTINTIISNNVENKSNVPFPTNPESNSDNVNSSSIVNNNINNNFNNSINISDNNNNNSVNNNNSININNSMSTNDNINHTNINSDTNNNNNTNNVNNNTNNVNNNTNNINEITNNVVNNTNNTNNNITAPNNNDTNNINSINITNIDPPITNPSGFTHSTLGVVNPSVPVKEDIALVSGGPVSQIVETTIINETTQEPVQPNPLALQTLEWEETVKEASLESYCFFQLEKKILNKSDNSDFANFIDNDPLFSSLSPNQHISILTNLFLWQGRKSFSHFLFRFEKYYTSFQKLVDLPEKATMVLEILENFWKTSEHRQIVICQKFYSFEIVDHITIANWIFSKEDDFHKNYLWPILHFVTHKLTTKLTDIERELYHCHHQLERIDSPNLETNFEYLNLSQRYTMLNSSYLTTKNYFKDLVYLVFQKFVIVLSNFAQHIHDNHRFSILFHFSLGQLLSFGRKFAPFIRPYFEELDSLVFTNVHPRIRETFEKFKFY